MSFFYYNTFSGLSQELKVHWTLLLPGFSSSHYPAHLHISSPVASAAQNLLHSSGSRPDYNWRKPRWVEFEEIILYFSSIGLNYLNILHYSSLLRSALLWMRIRKWGNKFFVGTVRWFQKSVMKAHFLQNKVPSCETGIHSEYFPDHFPKLYLSSEQGLSVSRWVLCSVVGTVLQGSSDREREVPLTAYLPLKLTRKHTKATHTNTR